MTKSALKIEKAVLKIDGILDESEGKFHEKHKRYPNLLSEEDYVSLAEFLDIRKEEAATEYVREIEGIKHKVYQIAGSDIAFRLMGRFFQREGFFRGEHQNTMFNAFLGRLEYNPPRRERHFRISAVEELKKKKVPFPTDYQEFLNTLGKIAGHYPTYPGKMGICFLPTIHEKVWNKPEGDKTRAGFENIGTHLVNPSAHTLCGLKRIINYEGLIEKLNRLIGNEEIGQYK